MGALAVISGLLWWSIATRPEVPERSPAASDGAATASVARDRLGPDAVSAPPADAGTLLHLADGAAVVDPLATSPTSDFPFGEIYSGLVRFGDLSDPLPEGDLASGWTVSQDGLNYVFLLRDGIRFSDGSPVTAHDVKWSWERALNPEHVSERAAHVFGAIVGAREMLDGQARTVRGLTVVDAQTLTVDLVKPQAHFALALADPVASVLSRENVENWDTLNWTKLEQLLREGFNPGDLDFFDLPVGTGPFRIARLEQADFAVLEPNPHNWRKVPAIGTLQVVANTAHGSKLARLRGASDYASLGVQWADEHGITYRGVVQLHGPVSGDAPNPPTAHFKGVGAPSVSFLALNSAIEPLDDVDFRRALSFAAQRAPLSAVVYNDVIDRPAGGLIPPGIPGSRPSAYPDRPDRAAAEASMAAALATSPELEPALSVSDDGSVPFVGMFWLLMRNWRDWLGVTVDDDSVPGFEAGDYESWANGRSSGSYDAAPIIEFDRLLSEGILQMRYVHVKPRYPDPCAILCRIPDLFGPNAQSDETRQLREMLDDAAATADRAARIAKYQAIEDHILDRALVIPVFWDDGTVNRLVKPYISGYKVPAYGGSMYEDVVVDTTHPDYPTGR